MSEFEDDRPSVKFNYVGGYNNGETFLEFKYKQPSISVKTQANYKSHDVFGDVTVRQKLGEKPDEISIEGLCTYEEANKVDELVYEEVVELVSHRWSGVVHIASTSTNPISQGGGKDMEGEWVYNCTIEAVEITEDVEDTIELGADELLNIEEMVNDPNGF